MKLGKIFICINILVLSLLMYGEIYQNTSYRFDEYNRTIVYVCRNGEWLSFYYRMIRALLRRRNLKIVIRKRKWFSRFLWRGRTSL